MFPSISDYISSIEGATDTLSTLNYLRPVRKPNGQPFFSSGNFAVVFKMEDTRNGGHMALKCFLRDVPDRARRLRLIGEWIADNPSPYLLPMTYHTKELWVDCAHSDREEFDVVMMPWVEGVTLGEYVRGLCGMIELDWGWRGLNKMTELASHFDELSRFLIEQPFAHGDIKPDNVIVLEDLPEVDLNEIAIRLVDYDGCFVPALSGEKAIETGTPPYRHPDRNINHFDRHIDDFALLTLSLEIYSLTRERKLFVAGESLILPINFAQQSFNSLILTRLRDLKSRNVSARTGLLEFAIHTKPGEIEGLRKLWPENSIYDASSLIPCQMRGKWGFCNHRNRIVIDCVFDEVCLFSEGLAAVKKDGFYGFIDESGDEAIEIMYEKVGKFTNGIAGFTLGNEMGHVDKFGNETYYDLSDTSWKASLRADEEKYGHLFSDDFHLYDDEDDWSEFNEPPSRTKSHNQPPLISQFDDGTNDLPF